MFKFNGKRMRDTSVEAYAACICNCALASCSCAWSDCKCLGTSRDQKLYTVTHEVNQEATGNSGSENSTVAGH